MTKRIPLTQGKFAIVDDDDFERLSKFKWCAVVREGWNVVYACRRTVKNGKQYQLFMHRFILGIDGKQVCDHINGDGLDNRRSNLRVVTALQNSMNKSPMSGRRFKGITKSRGKFKADIKVNYKSIFLGRFDRELDAAKAYNIAALKYHGEFARLNKIP